MYVLLIVVCPFALFLFVIVLSVLLQYADSAYHFGIFKLFLQCKGEPISYNQCKTYLSYAMEYESFFPV